MSDPNEQPAENGNPFVPHDLGSMTADYRQTYAARLRDAHDRLLEFRRTSNDGEALAEVIDEMAAALEVLGSPNGDARGPDAS